MIDDPTRIDVSVDPFARRMSGVARHGMTPFDVPFISQIEGNFYQGGCATGLRLPANIEHVVSLYPWEQYGFAHQLKSMSFHWLYDDSNEPPSGARRLDSSMHRGWSDAAPLPGGAQPIQPCRRARSDEARTQRYRCDRLAQRATIACRSLQQDVRSLASSALARRHNPQEAFMTVSSVLAPLAVLASSAIGTFVVAVLVDDVAGILLAIKSKAFDASKLPSFLESEFGTRQALALAGLVATAVSTAAGAAILHGGLNQEALQAIADAAFAAATAGAAAMLLSVVSDIKGKLAALLAGPKPA